MVAKKQTPGVGAGPLRWDDARVFLSLWRHGSLKRAAKELELNISTVSRRLEGMEEALRTRLFDRFPDGLRKTMAAERIAPYAVAIEASALQFEQALANFETEVAGAVRLTAPPGLLEHFIIPYLPQLLEQHPQLQLELQSSVALLDLARLEAEIALRTSRPSAGDVLAQKLIDAKWVLAASPAYAERIGELEHVDQPFWLAWGESLSQLPEARWVAKHVPADRVRVRFGSMDGLLGAVRQGLGVAVLPEPFTHLAGVSQVRCASGVRQSLDALAPVEVWIAGHAKYRNVPRIAAVWDWLVQTIQRPTPGEF
ncbi:MAG: LysR family transcriptional regulator [Deltaproteobacteria bacterium]|nr:LysR family transcriptional regulator [Deltaproteobacteria bacterium]